MISSAVVDLFLGYIKLTPQFRLFSSLLFCLLELDGSAANGCLRMRRLK
jgi:hypothetical protein